MTITHEGTKYQAYTIAEYGQLARILVDYRYVFDRIMLLEGAMENADLELSLRMDQHKLCMGTIDTLSRDREILQDGWMEENKLRLKEQSRRNIREWFAWGLVIVEALFVGAISIRLYREMKAVD